MASEIQKDSMDELIAENNQSLNKSSLEKTVIFNFTMK